MEQELEEFLEEREVDPMIIEEMKTEKVDIATISKMDDVDLKKFIKKVGDRIAVKDFCNRNKNNTRRESLLEKLRRKLEEKDSSKKFKSTSDDATPSTSRGDTSGSQRKKDTRMVAFGWIRNNIQVRSKNGGGCRRLSVPKTWKKSDLINKAKQLFFPQNEDDEELLSNACTLLDFKHHEFDDDLTVEDIFNITKISTMTFYLSTKKVLDTKINQSKSSAPHETETEKESVILPNIEQEIEIYSNTNLEYIDLNGLYDNFPITVNNEIIENKEHMKITLHRGHVFNELLIFKPIINLNIVIEVEMTLPNGTKELAYDVGGLYRDALCEFWIHFYESCCTGYAAKIPVVRHDFDETTWKTTAKILLQGYYQTKYFPAKLARPFMEQIIFKSVKSNITEIFLQYLGPYDSKIIKNSLDHPAIADTDINEVNEVLENYQCRTVIKEDNIHKIIRDIGHTEMIQKPMFVIDAWTDILENKFSYDDIINIYDLMQVSNKNVLNLIKKSEEDNVSLKEVQIIRFVKRFIREVDTNILENFLRFCTGSDTIITDEIKIEFNNTKGLVRTPIAHTCSCILELSLNYDTYNEFRYEMNSVLTSNVWVMDVI